MNHKLLLILFFVSLTTSSRGQTDPNNVPMPPVEQLKIFEPYYGHYEHIMNYAGQKWSGTMEIKPSIKGWYVDWVILTQSEDGSIDREYRMMVTWDKKLNKYRVWRFETLPPFEGDIKLYTEGKDIIIEAYGSRPDGRPGIFYNRYTMPDENQIKIITEGRNPDGQKILDIGTTIAKRIK